MPALSDRTVVVTRPREQAVDLQNALERLGARVILFPTIEIAAPDSYADLDDAVKNLTAFDWLIFTSANAVEHFLRRVEVNEIDAAEIDYLRVCAIGEATFERLRLAQIHVDVVPTEANAETVFAEIINYVGGENELADLRFLLPRSNIAREFLPEKLREHGAIVVSAVAYQTVLPVKPETGKLIALLQSGAIDCITFTSPSTLKNFVKIFENHELPRLLKNVALACIGETTANTARENGFEIAVVASEANADAFADGIAAYFKSETRTK